VNAVSEAPPLPSESRIARLVGSPWFWVAFFSVVFGYHLSRAMLFGDPPARAPEVLYPLPAFTLTDQFGKPFGSKDLEGKVWIANFVFTHCPTMCEGLTQSMAKVQKRVRHMRDTVQLVSFSVDPENDTPEVLLEYAKKHDANQLRWRFLTGELGSVKTAVVQGFKLPMEKDPPVDDALLSITHGSKLVLVDQSLRIRGYYDTDDESIQRLMADLAAVGN
jgi:protein SCO1/2